MISLKYSLTDFLFRALFSLVFIGLGTEHLFQDQLIREMMPDWIVAKRFFSIAAGLILLGGGFSLLLGYKVKQGATLLGAFLIVATFSIHLPAIFQTPPNLQEEWHWLWRVYQQSNLFKNLCLLGGCFHLLNHQVGTYSLESYLKNMKGKTQQS